MSLKVEIDWYHTGFTLGAAAPDFVGTGVDMSAPVDLVKTDAGPIVLTFGRDQTSSMAPIVAGTGSFTLDNADRRFSPRNASSPLFGVIKPARPVRITRTVYLPDYEEIYGDVYAEGSGGYSDFFSDFLPGAGLQFTLFYGMTDDSPINPDVIAKTVNVSAVDGLAYFRGVKITTALYAGIRTGDAINHILDACNWPTALRAIDPGATVMPWWWEDNEDAMDALNRVLHSEGSPALLTMGTEGEVIFMDRHHRLRNPDSITSKATWTTLGAEPQMNTPFEFDEAWQNIVNTGLAEVPVRAEQELQVVWENEGSISLPASGVRTIIASANDPFLGAVVPVNGTDYEIVSGSVTPTLSRTSGSSTTITLTAGGSGVVLKDLKLRAKPVTVANQVQVSVTDSTSVADYGQRAFSSDVPWCHPYDAEAILTAAKDQRKQPLPIIKVTFLISSNLPAYRAAEVLAHNLSDRVTVVEPETALNHDFFIESITHTLAGEDDHFVTFGLEMCPDFATPDPDTIFTFNKNVAGHRFNEGVFVL